MTNDAFISWANNIGIDTESISSLIECAATEAQVQKALDARESGPPIFTLSQIVEIHDNDSFKMNPGADGFVLVGCCPNGDSIALDFVRDIGTIWYIGHENNEQEDLISNAVRAGTNLRETHHAIMTDPRFPIDYYSAKETNAG